MFLSVLEFPRMSWIIPDHPRISWNVLDAGETNDVLSPLTVLLRCLTSENTLRLPNLKGKEEVTGRFGEEEDETKYNEGFFAGVLHST